jgi:hypothetical protein
MMFGHLTNGLLIVSLAALAAGTSWPAPAFAVGPRGTYSDWSFPGSGYYNIDTPIFPSNDPRPAPGQVSQAYFYSSQFGFAHGPGGYIGIQTDGRGKRAIFSIWNANDASCSDVPEAICRPFSGEGNGYQTIIPYDWVAGHSYRTRVWELRTDGAGEWWIGAIIDDTTGAEAVIGSIRVPRGRGWLSGAVNTWVEWYAAQAPDCGQVPVSVVFFGPPTANAREVSAGSSSNHYGNGACPSLLSNYAEWARHHNGWEAPSASDDLRAPEGFGDDRDHPVFRQEFREVL